MTAVIGERIQKARQSLGLSRTDVADRLGITEEWAYDLETYDDDLPSTLSLQQVRDLAALLALSVRELICGPDAATPLASTTPQQVSQAIRAAVSTSGMDTTAYSEAVGWDVASVVDDPKRLWTDWNLDQLKDVCDDLKIDWRTVLPPRTTAA